MSLPGGRYRHTTYVQPSEHVLTPQPTWVDPAHTTEVCWWVAFRLGGYFAAAWRVKGACTCVCTSQQVNATVRWPAGILCGLWAHLVGSSTAEGRTLGEVSDHSVVIGWVTRRLGVGEIVVVHLRVPAWRCKKMGRREGWEGLWSQTGMRWHACCETAGIPDRPRRQPALRAAVPPTNRAAVVLASRWRRSGKRPGH